MTVTVYEWIKELASYTDALALLRATSSYVVDGMTFKLPTRKDYETALVRSSTLRAGEALRDQAELVAAVQAHWHAEGHNACVFAAELSNRRLESGWKTYVVSYPEETLKPDSADEIAAMITELCRPSIADAEIEVVSVILPRLEVSSALARLLHSLGRLPEWCLRERGIENVAGIGETVLIGLRAKVELGHWAEVLGFGASRGQGNTRLAPFTELAIRVKEPPRPRRNQRAYMADIEMNIEKAQFGDWWHTTKRQRAERLGVDQDARAKARVTFAVARTVWEEAGA